MSGIQFNPINVPSGFDYYASPHNWTKGYICQGLGLKGPDNWKRLMTSAYALLAENKTADWGFQQGEGKRQKPQQLLPLENMLQQ